MIGWIITKKWSQDKDVQKNEDYKLELVNSTLS